jgi:hypothetical protein
VNRPVADASHLIALALVPFGGRRDLPLSGKSQGAAATQASDPGKAGYSLALELLLRVWQHSEEGAMQQRAAGDASLLLEMPLKAMTK